MTGRGYKNIGIYNKRAKWLGKQIGLLKESESVNDHQNFQTIYEETITALHFKYYSAQQLPLPLRQNTNRHNQLPVYKQLNLWAA